MNRESKFLTALTVFVVIAVLVGPKLIIGIGGYLHRPKKAPKSACGLFLPNGYKLMYNPNSKDYIVFTGMFSSINALGPVTEDNAMFYGESYSGNPFEAVGAWHAYHYKDSCEAKYAVIKYLQDQKQREDSLNRTKRDREIKDSLFNDYHFTDQSNISQYFEPVTEADNIFWTSEDLNSTAPYRYYTGKELANFLAAIHGNDSVCIRGSITVFKPDPFVPTSRERNK
jgi:hypothetical protein